VSLCCITLAFVNQGFPSNNHPVRLLVSTSPNQPANSVFLSQQTSTSQLKPAQKPTSEQAEYWEYGKNTDGLLAFGI